MCRLIWGFASRTYHIVGNPMSQLICLHMLFLRNLVIALKELNGKRVIFSFCLQIRLIFYVNLANDSHEVFWKNKDQTVILQLSDALTSDLLTRNTMYSKTCLKRPLQKKTEIGFQDRLLLNAGQKYCRMLQESILQYYRPASSYHLSLRPLFCLFLRQVLLYWDLGSQNSTEKISVSFGTPNTRLRVFVLSLRSIKDTL